MKEFNLNQKIFRLLKNEPFFAAISRTIAKIRNTNIPTAGVCINPTTSFFELHYNPIYLENLGKSDENNDKINEPDEIFIRKEIEIVGILKHEFYHLIFGHLTERLPCNSNIPEQLKLWNVATDLAINSFIFKELPFSACVPGRTYLDPETGKILEFFKNYPLYLSAEKYFSMLLQDPKIKEILEQIGQNGSEQGKNFQDGNCNDGEGISSGIPGIIDDHSMWDNKNNKVNNTIKNIAKNRLQKTIQDACNSVIKDGNNWGDISVEMQKEIFSRLESKVNWKNILRYFIKCSTKAYKVPSIKKINKRFAYIHPGKKSTRTANIAVSIDQSGSVSDKMLELFFSELRSLSKLVSFTVIPFDSEVQEEKIYVWKKGQKHPAQRVLFGGTNFNAPTDYVNKRNFDGHIILTDLDAPVPGKSKIQRMWVTTEQNKQKSSFQIKERIVVITDKEMEN